MYVDGDKDNKWFDINKMDKMTFSFEFVPLFNSVSSMNLNLREDFSRTTNIVITFFERHNGEETEAISFAFPFDHTNVEDNIYEINFEITLEDFMSNISHRNLENEESTYLINISYYVEDYVDESSNIFRTIIDNTIFKTYIPFNKNGDWLNGK